MPPFLRETSTDQSAECIKIFCRQKSELITASEENRCSSGAVGVELKGKGEVYVHAYSFSGETQVAGDLGFE